MPEEKATERTFAAKLAEAIEMFGKELGFSAEVEKSVPRERGFSDILVSYNGAPVCVIEVKGPDVPLDDPKWSAQVETYAEAYRARYRSFRYYAKTNLKYIELFKYDVVKRITLEDFYSPGGGRAWRSILSPVPPLLHGARSFDEHQRLFEGEGRNNLLKFLSLLRDDIEGKIYDPVPEIIGEIRGLISKGAASSLNQLHQRYREDEGIEKLVNEWIEERGLSAPGSDAELKEILERLLSEQLYTYAVKMMFYSVLRSNPELAPKLALSLNLLAEARNPKVFLDSAHSLFMDAIGRTGDFEEVFGSNLVDRLPLMPAS
ncbi:MAG: hypothetical protein ACP5UD_09985, partial [Conexivisphaera sp.]